MRALSFRIIEIKDLKGTIIFLQLNSSIFIIQNQALFFGDMSIFKNKKTAFKAALPHHFRPHSAPLPSPFTSPAATTNPKFICINQPIKAFCQQVRLARTCPDRAFPLMPMRRAHRSISLCRRHAIPLPAAGLPRSPSNKRISKGLGEQHAIRTHFPYPIPFRVLKGENFASEPREPSEGGECTKEVHDPTEVRLPPANSITKFYPLNFHLVE